jgi:hypothetical protein
MEFPGFSGDPVDAICDPLRIAPGLSLEMTATTRPLVKVAIDLLLKASLPD